MPEIPGVVWVGLAWLLASACLTAAIARWFRIQRDLDRYDNE